MDFEISNLNTLNHLAGRAVRGAKPGSYNSTGSGKVYVTTSIASKTAPIKEYLLQPAIEANTRHGSAKFTVGSKVVTTTDSFAGIQVGDSFRKDGEHAVYSVSAVDSLTSLKLNKNFYPDSHAVDGSEIPGDYTSVKILFGKLSYDSVENTESNPYSFRYSNTSGRWSESSGVPHAGPYSSSSTTFKDGISLEFVGRSAAPTPDFQGVGTISGKIIAVPTTDPVNSLSMPVVPYPSDLSTLKVEEKLISETDYAPLDNVTDCFVDYTGSPVPVLDQPPFGLRSNARLFRTNKTFAYTEITPTYSGQWAVSDNEGRVTGMLLGTEEVTIGDANNPPYISEDHVVTQEDVDAGGFNLSFTPVSKVAVNINESSAQSEGLDFVVSAGYLSWKDRELEAEIYPGVVIRCIYQATGESIKLYLYKDYLLDPVGGVITTIKSVTGAVYTLQYFKLTAADVSNKYVVLGAAPVGPVALNVASGPTQSMSTDYKIEGNRLSWDGMRLDGPNMTPGVVLRVMYQSGSGEDPVKYMMRDINLFNCGIRAFRSVGDFSNVNLDDPTTWGTEILLGKDFFVNEATGALRIEKTLSDSDMVFFNYNGKGSDVTDTLDPSSAPLGEISDNLRLSTYPVIPYTIGIQAVGPKGTRTLLENKDFILATDTGILTLLTKAYPGDKFYATYKSAAPSYYAIKMGSGSYTIRAYEEPCRAVSNKAIKLYNSGSASTGMDIGTLVVRSTDGKLLPVKGAKFDNSTGTITFQENANFVANELYIVDYEYQGKSLPFAPIMRLSKYARKNQNWISTDGYPDADNIAPGQVLAIAAYDTQAYQYYQIKSILNPTGINRRLVLNRPFSADVLEPQVKLSDVAIDFNPFSSLLVAPYVAGATSITIEGDLSNEFGIGRMFIVEDSSPNTKSEIYRIKSAVYDGTNTRVDFNPPAATSESRPSVLANIKASAGVIYQEGDTALITQYPVYPGYFPMWKVAYLPEDGFATIRVNEDKVVLTETTSAGSTNYEVPIQSGYKVDDIATSIEALGGGNKFSVSWLFPKGAGTFQDNMERSQADFRLPYIVNCRAQVLRKAESESVFSMLEWGAVPGAGDFHFTGSYIQLEKPLSFGDKFIVSYLGIDNLAIHRGRSLQIESKNIVPMPGQAKYRISCDYYKPDQIYLQTTTEKDFLDKVVGPYLEQAEASREGQKPMGSDGPASAEDPSNADGGLMDSFYSLRDESLKLALYKEAYGYYVNRMGAFALEYEAISAMRIANCEFSGGTEDPRFNLTSFGDIDNYATFGTAPFSPVGYDGVDPQVDGRFSGSYLSYGEANFFNYGGHGVMISSKAEFSVRDIGPGDFIRINGSSTQYEISQRVSDEELHFTTLISKKPASSGYEYHSGKYQQRIEPLFSWLGGVELKDIPMKGYKYWVTKAQAPAVPLLDGSGCPDAVARTAYGEPFALSEQSSFSNILHVQVTTDAGLTWQDYEINLSFLEEPFTASKVAAAIRKGVTVFNPSEPGASESIPGLGELFTISAERVYGADGVDSSMTLDTSWPLALPDKHEASGSSMGIVMRANNRDTWFRFTEPTITGGTAKKTGASTLGFPVDVIFKGNKSSSSAVIAAGIEKNKRIEEVVEVNKVLTSYDKMSRGINSLYIVPLKAKAAVSSAASAVTRSSIQVALSAVNTILVETDATDAISQSHSQALAMKTKYETQVADVTEAIAEDTSYISSLTSDPYGYTSSITQHVKSRTAAMLETADTYQTGTPTFTIGIPTGMVDPRVAWGDRTLTASFAGKSLFPKYVQSSMPAGARETYPKSTWFDTLPAGEGVLHISASITALSAKVTVNTTAVIVSYQTVAMSTALPPLPITSNHSVSILLSEKPTVADIAAAITASGAGQVAARVSKGSTLVLSTAEKALYGSIPSTLLAKVTDVPVATTLAVHPKWYSDTRIATIAMQEAVLISPLPGVVSPTVDVTVAGVTVHSTTIPLGSITVLYTGHTTVGSFMSALQAAISAYFTITWNSLDSSYKYGSFVPTTGRALPGSLYYDVKGDISYFTVSDDNLAARQTLTAERGVQVDASIADYAARKPQIEVSVGTEGESLYDNMYLWLRYITDKEAGPCTMIPYMKKRLLNSKLLKEATT